ncbi:hypothetical protein AVEN_21037-1 [Araneus ventricosus]|uniref:Uncharacterized protein n=1 Tax=Araneus ventricosus TaxID=182803 RepID=A0A4Y2H2K5_ARAVE|nr:hypothetical protein AVEN_21037-1 [Araneus ventricosus]
MLEESHSLGPSIQADHLRQLHTTQIHPLPLNTPIPALYDILFKQRTSSLNPSPSTSTCILTKAQQSERSDGHVDWLYIQPLSHSAVFSKVAW